MIRNEREALNELARCNDCRCSSWAIARAEGKCPRCVPIVSRPMPALDAKTDADPRPARWLVLAFVAVFWCVGLVVLLS